MKTVISAAAFLVLSATAGSVLAGPWFTDLEEDMQSLPWVLQGELIRVADSAVIFVVEESFAGEHEQGDTLEVPFWEMGRWMADGLLPGENMLFLPDPGGDLQIIGYPREGFWLLRGFFDFNAFWVNPGVISRGELLLLCQGDTLTDRRIDVNLVFAGGEAVTGVTFLECGDHWMTESSLLCLDGLRLESWMVEAGGIDSWQYEPDTRIMLQNAEGDRLELSGLMRSYSQGSYHCSLYPVSPLLPDRRALVDFMAGTVPSSPPDIDIQLFGSDPAELGLGPSPRFVIDGTGNLRLRTPSGDLSITSIRAIEGSERPHYGFDETMTCSDPVYFSFDGLPDGPSGHLATDILDALAKGYVDGSIYLSSMEPEARFRLFLLR